MSPTMLATDAMSAPESQVPVSHLVEVLGAELTELAGLADALQDVVAEIALSTEMPRRSLLEEAQSLDLIVQRLRSLASFLQRVGPGLPPAWSLDAASAARQVTLASLASRLCSAAPGGDSGTAEAGDFDLF